MGKKLDSKVLFFFNDTATTEIYTLSLHDALPICHSTCWMRCSGQKSGKKKQCSSKRDRKSTRLNSSHLVISYAVFCLKKKLPHALLKTRSGLGDHVAYHANAQLLLRAFCGIRSYF